MSFSKRVLGKWYDNDIIRWTFELFFVVLPVAFVIRTFGFGLYQVPTGSMETTLLVGERFFADKLTYWFRSPRRGEIIACNEPYYQYSSNKVVNLWQRYVSWNVVNWTKRVIGIPGDHVKGLIEDGHPVVYLNGEKLDESGYVNKYPLILLWSHSPDEGGGSGVDYRSFVPDVPWDQQPFYKINSELVIRNPETDKPEDIKIPGTPHSGGKDVFDVTLGDNEYWVMGDNRLGSGDSREWGALDGTLIHGKIVFRIWSMDTREAWLPLSLLKRPIKTFTQDTRWSRCMQFVY